MPENDIAQEVLMAVIHELNRLDDHEDKLRAMLAAGEFVGVLLTERP